jgi:protein AATF/BFR2
VTCSEQLRHSHSESPLTLQRNPGPQSVLALEEPHYRALLREIIDSRTTGSSHLPDTSYRLEKKKKRDAERGASKGRKIRYTVHEKAANFAVPMEIMGGWGEGQVDELFSSLLGGAGMGGGRSEGQGAGMEGMAAADIGEGGGLSGLGGLRVF